MICLGIESSCDETSICILNDRKIVAMKTFSQIDLHASYGGVVPEIAARDHLAKINILTQQCLFDAKMTMRDIDLISVTSIPGLAGGLLVGIMFAKGLSIAHKKQIVYVNHLEGHMFTAALTHGIAQNFYCLLVSGGHTQLICVDDINSYKIVGKTLDDSIGEAFDKISKALGLGYPGGAKIEELAKLGNENILKFAVPMKKYDDFNFSLSGLKTFFIRIIEKNQYTIHDICASFQKIVTDIIEDRVKNIFQSEKKYDQFVLCGGVASNNYIRKRLQSLCDKYAIQFTVPQKDLCTDNAAMIANIGIMKFASVI